MLLLDEPTNHLDNAAIKWLGNFLRTSGDSYHRVEHSVQHGRRCPGDQGTATNACSAGLGCGLIDWVFHSGECGHHHNQCLGLYSLRNWCCLAILPTGPIHHVG